MKKLMFIALAITSIGIVDNIYSSDKSKEASDKLEPSDVLREIGESGDAREFLADTQYQGSRLWKGGTKLWTRCSSLSKNEPVQEEVVDGKVISSPVKDAALLNFAKTMDQQEREWRSWYMRDGLGGKKIYLGEDITTAGGKKLTLFRGEDSPHFKFCSISNSEINVMNVVENHLYHDELKFLTTQLHKMDLYWSIKPTHEKTAQQQTDFGKTRSLLVQEIESFENQNNRMAFTHSCMKAKDFQDVQKGRHAYQEDAWNNRPWYQKLWRRGERKQFNQSVIKLNDLTVKKELKKAARAHAVKLSKENAERLAKE